MSTSATVIADSSILSDPANNPPGASDNDSQKFTIVVRNLPPNFQLDNFQALVNEKIDELRQLPGTKLSIVLDDVTILSPGIGSVSVRGLQNASLLLDRIQNLPIEGNFLFAFIDWTKTESLPTSSPMITSTMAATSGFESVVGSAPTSVHEFPTPIPGSADTSFVSMSLPVVHPGSLHHHPSSSTASSITSPRINNPMLPVLPPNNLYINNHFSYHPGSGFVPLNSNEYWLHHPPGVHPLPPPPLPQLHQHPSPQMPHPPLQPTLQFYQQHNPLHQPMVPYNPHFKPHHNYYGHHHYYGEGGPSGAYKHAHLPRLFIGNIPYATRWQILKSHLSAAGDIQRVEIAMDHEQRSKGFAIATFYNREDALNAIEMFDGKAFLGRELTVRFDKFSNSHHYHGSSNINNNNGSNSNSNGGNVSNSNSSSG
ncbi:hypothetical protein D0Z00_004413 [Geotrichum galactomycetum]|uniref:Uncharacterized protein n=1 Tax=Geotrichum galactomycetum TaxID=27317 RepID=A0ACB6UYH7_9ASCO|nr:hypothetical protein D0Z00_004413 [Geotrichum candidum]